MKTTIRTTLFIVASLMLAASCKDRNAEKKIAALESELKELKGKSTANTPSPETPVPQEKPEGPIAVLSFEKTEHDFGTIKEGQVVEYTFSFKNTGEVPLIVQDAQPSCGCTVPDWSKDPIPVGGTGFVKAKFDSNGKPNLQNKTVTVTANTWPKQTVLRFKAMVTPKIPDAPAEGPVRQ